jgi:capsular polysaccharide biosynthesis protein
MSEWLELGDLVRAVRRHRLLFALVYCSVVVLGAARSMSQEPVYEAKTSFIVGASLNAANLSKEDIDVGERLALTYADFTRRQPVMQGVVDAFDLDISWRSLARRVHVDLPDQNPRLIVVTVEADSPDEARALAHEVGVQLIALSPAGANGESQSFVSQMLQVLQNNIEGKQFEIDELRAQLGTAVPLPEAIRIRALINGAEKLVVSWQANYADLLAVVSTDDTANHLEVFEEAEANTDPVRPVPRFDIMVSSVLGACLALGIVYVLDGRKSRVRGSRKGKRPSTVGAPKHLFSDGARRGDRTRATSASVPPVMQRRSRG